MAVVYYPKSQFLYKRDTISASYETVVLAVSPNTILYFDTASSVSSASAMDVAITSSWALYSETSSFALNANAGSSISSSWSSASLSSSYLAPMGSYDVIVTSSLRWITASYLTPEQYVTIAVAAVYNFTCSNPPVAGQVANVTLYISNTVAATSSLSFPSDWVFLGTSPTYISASKSAVLSLKNYGGIVNVAAFAPQY